MWFYDNVPLDEKLLDSYVAFVYLITNLIDGRKYVGKKKVNFTRFKKVKNKKRRQKVVRKSDWETYFGSNEELKEDVSRLGEENFRREILHLCTSQSKANYLELKEQVIREVLFKPNEYYNSYIGTRVSRKQLGI